MDTFPLHNIHEHQMTFMRDFEKQDAISFFLIYYSTKNLLYYMRFEEIEVFWERMKQGGRKSVRFEELDEEYFFLRLRQGVFVPYLEMLQKDLNHREERIRSMEKRFSGIETSECAGLTSRVKVRIIQQGHVLIW